MAEVFSMNAAVLTRLEIKLDVTLFEEEEFSQRAVLRKPPLVMVLWSMRLPLEALCICTACP